MNFERQAIGGIRINDGLEPNEYVEELVEACNEIVEKEADAIEEKERRGSKRGA